MQSHPAQDRPAPSAESISVLHVDDDERFLDMSASLLEEADDAISVSTALDADSAADRLTEGSIDCVVSDYQMPGTDGLELLESVRSRHGELPFILFTGKGSEEIASEAISAGVTDYLQKGGPDRYAVLANRIRNAVERRRAQHQVRHAYRAIDTAREGISILDADGEFTYVNQAYCDLYGYTEAELLGEHWSILYPDGEVDTILEEVFPEMEAAGVWRGTTVGLRADGSTFREDHTLAETDSGGLICAVRDADRAGADD